MAIHVTLSTDTIGGTCWQFCGAARVYTEAVLNASPDKALQPAILPPGQRITLPIPATVRLTVSAAICRRHWAVTRQGLALFSDAFLLRGPVRITDSHKRGLSTCGPKKGPPRMDQDGLGMSLARAPLIPKRHSVEPTTLAGISDHC